MYNKEVFSIEADDLVCKHLPVLLGYAQQGSCATLILPLFLKLLYHMAALHLQHAGIRTEC